MVKSSLDDAQVEQLRAQLKRYGIESPELLAELSDHFGEQMEERMAAGLGYEEAFAQFKAENSWLKLRKLQFKHWEQWAYTVQRLFKSRLYQFFLGPLSLLSYPMMAGLWWLSGTDVASLRTYFIALHVGLGAAMLATIAYIFLARLIKRRYFVNLFQFALWSLYLLLYLPSVTSDFFSYSFLSDDNLWMRAFFTLVYTAIVLLAYLFWHTFAWAMKQLRVDAPRV